MISLYDSNTFELFPAEMRTPERAALCYAVDRQIKKYIDRMKRVHIWANLEDVEDKHLDMLAVECRVLFYNTELPPDTKRKMILNSMYWYMKLGTSQAMKEMIDIVFDNNNTSVEEWFTYAGEPFHFRIAVGSDVTQTSISEFLRHLKKVKNARSRFDYLVLQNSVTLRFSTQEDFQNFIYTFCGEFECGTYPNTEIGLELAGNEIVVSGEEETYSTIYEKSGTNPDISVGTSFTDHTVELSEETEEFSTIYPDNETPSGTTPETSVGFEHTEAQVDIQETTEVNQLIYSSDGETESGTNPGTSFGFTSEETQIGAEGAADDYGITYPESGTTPDQSVGFSGYEARISTESAADDYGIAYPETGTMPDQSVGFTPAEGGVNAGVESADFDLYYQTSDKYAGEE